MNTNEWFPGLMTTVTHRLLYVHESSTHADTKTFQDLQYPYYLLHITTQKDCHTGMRHQLDDMYPAYTGDDQEDADTATHVYLHTTHL